MSKALKGFTVWGRLNVEVSIEIKATDLDNALVKAKELEIDDFIKWNGDLYDAELEVRGVLAGGWL